jgi:hypothetical protein
MKSQLKSLEKNYTTFNVLFNIEENLITWVCAPSLLFKNLCAIMLWFEYEMSLTVSLLKAWSTVGGVIWGDFDNLRR